MCVQSSCSLTHSSFVSNGHFHTHRNTRVGEGNLSERLSKIESAKGMIKSDEYARDVVRMEVALMDQWLSQHMGRGMRARRFTVASNTDAVLDCFLSELLDLHLDIERTLDNFKRNERRVLVAMGDGLQGNPAGGHGYAPLPLVSASCVVLVVW